MIIIIVAVISVIIITAQAYVIKNLLKKVETYEEDISLKDEFIEKFKSMVEEASAKIKQIDLNGTFEADDEVGYFFNNLKNITLTLDAYFKNYVSEEKQ
jgi:hypothetical protein